jgi:hypothetical protein
MKLPEVLYLAAVHPFSSTTYLYYYIVYSGVSVASHWKYYCTEDLSFAPHRFSSAKSPPRMPGRDSNMGTCLAAGRRANRLATPYFLI